MLMVSTTCANKYSVINNCSSISQFSLCNYCSLCRLSLSSFSHSFRFTWQCNEQYHMKDCINEIWSISKLNSLLTRMTLSTKYGPSVNLIYYSSWQEWPYQIWSISKLSSSFTVTRTIALTKYGRYIGRLHSNIFVILSTFMEVSISLLCLFVHKPPYQTWSISKLNSLLSISQTTVPNMKHQ